MHTFSYIQYIIKPDRNHTGTVHIALSTIFYPYRKKMCFLLLYLKNKLYICVIGITVIPITAQQKCEAETYKK